MFFTLTSLVARSLSADLPFDPFGRWQTFHKDGSSFEIIILPDGTATSTADNQRGIWRWEKKSLVIDFTDGWRDVIEKDPKGLFNKKSWAPNVDRSKPSQNISPIKRAPTPTIP